MGNGQNNTLVMHWVRELLRNLTTKASALCSIQHMNLPSNFVVNLICLPFIMAIHMIGFSMHAFLCILQIAPQCMIFGVSMVTKSRVRSPVVLSFAVHFHLYNMPPKQEMTRFCYIAQCRGINISHCACHHYLPAELPQY